MRHVMIIFLLNHNPRPWSLSSIFLEYFVAGGRRKVFVKEGREAVRKHVWWQGRRGLVALTFPAPCGGNDSFQITIAWYPAKSLARFVCRGD